MDPAAPSSARPPAPSGGLGDSPSPRRRGRTGVRVTGWVLMAIGLLVVLYGMAPLLDALDIIGEPPSEESGAAADAMVAELKARVWFDVGGFALLILGAVVEAAGRKPTVETIDDRIQMALEERDRQTVGRREGREGPP